MVAGRGRACAQARYQLASGLPWSDEKDRFTKVKVKADMATAGFTELNMNYWFYAYGDVTSFEGLGNLRPVSRMRHAFSSCTAVTELDLTGFDPSSLTDLFYAFAGCSALMTIYVDADWALPSGCTGNQCFYSCKSLVGGNGTARASGERPGWPTAWWTRTGRRGTSRRRPRRQPSRPTRRAARRTCCRRRPLASPAGSRRGGLEVVAAEAQGCSQKGGPRALVAVGEGVVADHAVAQAADLGDVALVEVPTTEGLPGLSQGRVEQALVAHAGKAAEARDGHVVDDDDLVLGDGQVLRGVHLASSRKTSAYSSMKSTATSTASVWAAPLPAG